VRERAEASSCSTCRVETPSASAISSSADRDCQPERNTQLRPRLGTRGSANDRFSKAARRSSGSASADGTPTRRPRKTRTPASRSTSVGEVGSIGRKHGERCRDAGGRRCVDRRGAGVRSSSACRRHDNHAGYAPHETAVSGTARLRSRPHRHDSALKDGGPVIVLELGSLRRLAAPSKCSQTSDL
jgi:hypothetical protein